MNDKEWYFWDEEFGEAVACSFMLAAQKAAECSPEDFVWTDGFDDWRQIQHTELASYLLSETKSPPLPPPAPPPEKTLIETWQASLDRLEELVISERQREKEAQAEAERIRKQAALDVEHMERDENDLYYNDALIPTALLTLCGIFNAQYAWVKWQHISALSFFAVIIVAICLYRSLRIKSIFLSLFFLTIYLSLWVFILVRIGITDFQTDGYISVAIAEFMLVLIISFVFIKPILMLIPYLFRFRKLKKKASQ